MVTQKGTFTLPTGHPLRRPAATSKVSVRAEVVSDAPTKTGKGPEDGPVVQPDSESASGPTDSPATAEDAPGDDVVDLTEGGDADGGEEAKTSTTKGKTATKE